MDLRNKIQAALFSSPRASWRLAATCVERREARMCPSAVIVTISSCHGRRGEARRTVVLPLTEESETYTSGPVWHDVRPAVCEDGTFHLNASLIRPGMHAVHFEGDAHACATGWGGLLQMRSALSTWTINLHVNGKSHTRVNAPSGPRDNNDIEYVTVFVPTALVRVVVSPSAGE